LSAGRVQGTIPGSDSILSLAALDRGFLVGTNGGVLESSDATTWLAATNIPREPVFVASDGTTAYVHAGQMLKDSSDLRTFATVATGVTGTVVAPGPDRGAPQESEASKMSVYVLAGRSIERVASRGAAALSPLPAPAAPGVFALAVVPGRPGSVLVGTVGGLWRTDDAGVTW